MPMLTLWNFKELYIHNTYGHPKFSNIGLLLWIRCLWHLTLYLNYILKLSCCLSQLLGITMRADIPLGLDMLACVWKLLVGAELDPVTDLKEADLLTYNYIKKIEMVRYQENQKCFFLPIVITITFKVLHDNMLMFISKFSQIIASMNMYMYNIWSFFVI